MNSRGLRIAFGYRARVGKSTSVNYLISKYSGIELSFAKPVYDIAAYFQMTCDFPVEKDRELLQFIGGYARSKNPDIWLNIMKRQIDRIESHDELFNSRPTNIFISDLRYPNEAEFLKNNGFTLVNIERDTSNINFQGGDRNHSSELSLKCYNYWNNVIVNDSSLDNLYDELNRIIL